MPSPALARHEIPVVTTFDLEGHRVTANLGTCSGLVVRSMGFAKSFGASLRQLRGGNAIVSDEATG
jgi:uncharacterized protein YbjQ (UPF0145 family)